MNPIKFDIHVLADIELISILDRDNPGLGLLFCCYKSVLSWFSDWANSEFWIKTCKANTAKMGNNEE